MSLPSGHHENIKACPSCGKTWTHSQVDHMGKLMLNEIQTLSHDRTDLINAIKKLKKENLFAGLEALRDLVKRIENRIT
jgi:hypothetical protein